MSFRENTGGAAAAVGAALIAVLALSCGGSGDRGEAPPRELPAGAAEALGLDREDPASWVRIYDPRRAAGGYMLSLWNQRIPVLLDMNGHVVHAWPEVRLKSRARLLPDGSLLGLALGHGVAEYDWRGRLTWEHRLGDELPHHDLIRLANGNTMVLAYHESRRTDDALEIDRDGRVVWRWRSAEHLIPLADRPLPARGDLTHINSVQELPDNPWHRGGDARFRPGNLLLSARNLDLVFVVDRRTGEVVWTFGEGLDLQHEALMTDADWPRPGNILIFNNRYSAHRDDRQSEILELQPLSGEIVRRYRSPAFFCDTSGVEQPLPGGNLLIASSRGGRVFEIDGDERIVWEWTPRYRVTRPSRYPYDHTPQLAALGRPAERPVRPPAGYAWVDGPVYRFARAGERREIRVGGRKHEYLADNDKCARMFLPAAPTLELAYGLDPRPLAAAGREEYRAEVRVLVTTEPDAGGEAIEVHRNVLDLAGEQWHRERVGIERFGLQPVELCIATEEVGDPDAATEPFVYWVQPYIFNAYKDYGEGIAATTAADTDLDADELEARKRHLRAMGYVD